METNPPSRRPILIWLVVFQVLALASLFFWLLIAGLLSMLTFLPILVLIIIMAGANFFV